jgi:hypothetical protein
MGFIVLIQGLFDVPDILGSPGGLLVVGIHKSA